MELLNFTDEDIQKLFKGEPAFRHKQFRDWLFNKRVCDLEEMKNIPQSLKEKLKIYAKPPVITDRVDCEDGATKLLIDMDGLQVETVILRYEQRTSLCVSSQVGCKLACKFCQTGKLGFMRHLTGGQILAQYYLASKILREEGKKISHVVFMGMGEPFDNYKNAIFATNRMIKDIGMSARQVTVSTSGITPKIIEFTNDSTAALAISLHAADDQKRSGLMPINTKYPLEKLKEALLYYQRETGRVVTIEYILIKDENCSILDAKKLVKFVHGLKCKINLIPFNAHPGMPYARPDDEQIREFQKYLAQRSLPAPVRYSKGLGISAACGQLAAKNKNDLNSIPRRENITSSLNH